jgi:hypothetical protein
MALKIQYYAAYSTNNNGEANKLLKQISSISEPI